MRSPGAGRRGWLTAPGWSSGPPMRRWTPAWRQGWTPSKPPSHVGPGRTTRGSRAIPGPAVRWRRRWRTTKAGKWWARSPRTACPWGALTTFWWTGLTGDITLVPSWVLGRRRQASGRGGGGVRRHLRPSDPISVSRGPLAGSTMATDATASLFWPGLTLSPWRLSVVRGTQLPQRVGAHVCRRNSGTHCLLRWSVTNKLLPIGFHVNHEFFFPPLDHLRGRSLGDGPCVLLCHRRIDRVHAGRWRRCWGLDKRGRGTRKKSSKARGGWRGHFFINSRNCRWRNRGRAPCERSCETSWRSTRSWGGSRQRSRLVYTDQVRGDGGAPSGPHPGRWRSRVTGSGKRHPDPGVWGLGLGSPRRVLEPGEGRGEVSSGRRRHHRRTGRYRSDRLRGMYG